MKHTITLLICILFLTLSIPLLAQTEDKIELETTVIKGNTELPKFLYVVPWQDISDNKKAQQKLTLHSLFGDVLEPVTPQKPATDDKN